MIRKVLCLLVLCFALWTPTAEADYYQWFYRPTMRVTYCDNGRYIKITRAMRTPYGWVYQWQVFRYR